MILYHGTTTKNYNLIKRFGFKTPKFLAMEGFPTISMDNNVSFTSDLNLAKRYASEKEYITKDKSIIIKVEIDEKYLLDGNSSLYSMGEQDSYDIFEENLQNIKILGIL